MAQRDGLAFSIVLRMVLGITVMPMLPGCERIMQDMYQQPRDNPYGRNSLFEDGKSSREPLPNTVVYTRGAQADASSGRHGRSRVGSNDAADRRTQLPSPLEEQTLVRGRQRYEIYCLPCHSPAGDGDGRVVRRGFPAPPSYHSERLRKASDRHFYDVISKGYGVMHAYGDRVDPTDRWAIVAYIRALQLSQYANIESLPNHIADKVVEALRDGSMQGAPP